MEALHPSAVSRSSVFYRVSSILLALFLIQPIPNKISKQNKNLAPKTIASSVSFAQPQLAPLLLSQNVWTVDETKVLGTMLDPNPDGSFTLPPKRRVMGLARDPENKEGLYQTANGNWHGRPTDAIQERIVDNFKGEIAMTANLQAALFKIVNQIASNPSLTSENWPAVVSSAAFKEKVQQETAVIGKTLDQVLYIVEQLGNQITSKKLKVKKPGALQTAYAELMQIFLGPDEVIVEGFASGLNANGDWASTGFPISIIGNDFHVLGSDLYGRVIAAGRNVKRFKVGDMAVFQTSMHDKDDPNAHGGHPGKLKSYHITGYEDPIGTFTDFYKNDAMAFMPVTEEEVKKKVQVLDGGKIRTGATVEEMSSYGLVLPTVEHSLNRLGVAKNSVVIMEGGNGGTGRYGIQAAKARGAYVIGVVSSEARGQEVMQLGADAYINRRDSQLVQVDDALWMIDKFLKTETTVPEIEHSMVLDEEFDLGKLREKLENLITFLKTTTLQEAIKKTSLILEGVSKKEAGFYYTENYKRLETSINKLLSIEKLQPGFVFRSVQVLNANATHEDMRKVNEDYVESVKKAVKQIWKTNGLTRKSFLADAVINFMGTQTYGRHAMSVRAGDFLNGDDLGGSTASFGGGSGFKVQYPGQEGITNIDTMMKRISKYRRRAGIDDHIKKVVVMVGERDGAKVEVEEMVSSPGRKVLVVVRSEKDLQRVLEWGLLREGIDGIINTSAPKQKIIVEGDVESKIEQLQALRKSSLVRQPTAIVVETKEEKNKIIASPSFNKDLDVVYSRDDDYVVTSLAEMDVDDIERQKVEDQKAGIKRNYVFLVQNKGEKGKVLNFYMKVNKWVKRGMFHKKRDIFLEPYTIQANLDNPMPETPMPLSYTPTQAELKAQGKKERAYAAWLNNDARGLGKAIWLHWGKGSSPDLVFGRAGWPTSMASLIYVLDRFGQVAVRGDMSNKMYDFDIRHFWMFQKVILTATQAMIGTHYASPRESLDAHKLVKEGVVKLAPVTVYPWEQTGKAQEEMVKGKNVILIGSPKAGLQSLKEVQAENIKRFSVELGSEDQATREAAAAQLHYQASLLADKAIADYSQVQGLIDLLAKPATCGVCVEPETFEQIKQAWGNPKVHTMESQNAREFEIALPGGIHLDILTPLDREKDSALVTHLNKRDEGIQQVEIFTTDVAKVVEVINANKSVLGSGTSTEKPFPGITGENVAFQLLKLKSGGRVLMEFVQASAEQIAQLESDQRTSARVERKGPFSGDWLTGVLASLESSI